MGEVSITIRADAETKAKREAQSEGLGMDVSAAVDILPRQCLRVNVFPVGADTPDGTTQEAFREGEAIPADPSAGGDTDMRDLRAAPEV